MKASSAMTREVITAPPELSLNTAWVTMVRHHFRHLPVVESGRLVGILSDRDVLLHARREGEAMVVPPMAVKDAMTPAPVTCFRSAEVAMVAGLMLERKIDAVPVIDALGALVGLVTSTDLLALLTRKDPATVLPFDFHLRPIDRDGRLAVA